MSSLTAFKNLSARVLALRKLFLPRRFSPTGSYNAETLDRARAFRLLVHAEIEHFFELEALSIADEAFDCWRNSRKATRPLACLAANFKGDGKGLPKQLGTKNTASEFLGRCVGQFRHTVRQNNGVRTENLLELFLPLGIDETEFDVAWLAALDTFGRNRGDTAHSSWIKYTIDPKGEYELIKQILEGTKVFCGVIDSARRSMK